ncbi:MAG: flavodoxin family protein [Rudaea sp.]
MRALVVYDSYFGNTAEIARAIGRGLGLNSAEVIQVREVSSDRLTNLDLLIVGSPTRGWRPTEGTAEWLKNLPENSLQHVKIAAFDTRLSLQDTKSAFTRFIVRTGGYAAPSISQSLKQKGGAEAAPAEGFLVIGEQGPLKQGELERAAEWGRSFIRVQQPA